MYAAIVIPDHLKLLGWESFGKYDHAMMLLVDKSTLTYFFIEKIPAPVPIYECKIVVGIDESILLKRTDSVIAAVEIFDHHPIAKMVRESSHEQGGTR